MIKLWLDDCREPPNKSWTWAKTVAEAKAVMAEPVAYASLDHDLGGVVPVGMHQDEAIYIWGDSKDGSGYDFVKWMAETDTWPEACPVVHSWNYAGAHRMCDMIDRYGPYNERCKYVPYSQTKE